jgi:AcrR family transcriptional regulator
MNKKTQYHHGDLKNALIKEGLKIISEDGIQGLTLRKVASRIGVTHTAPYAHFADKQALIAAISAEGHHELFKEMNFLYQKYQDEPYKQLVEIGWHYIQFAIKDPEYFRIMFSKVIEDGEIHPEFIEISDKNYEIVSQVIINCQKAGIIDPEDHEKRTIYIWSVIHGLATLIIEDQIPFAIQQRASTKEFFEFSIQAILKDMH